MRSHLPPGPRRRFHKPKEKTLPPGLPSLKELFHQSNLSLTEQQYKQLWQYHLLLREKNVEYDLTRLYQFEAMVHKHYIDCILAAKMLKGDLPSPLLDIGSGAGLPGIPLKIISPHTEFILAEGRPLRVQFLHEVIEALGLKKIEVYQAKISSSFARQVQGVITRALETIPKTLARIKNCLKPGGVAIFMKGPNCDEEIKEAMNTYGLDYRLVKDLAYTLPHTPHQRRLVIFERICPPREEEEGANFEKGEGTYKEIYEESDEVTDKVTHEITHEITHGESMGEEPRVSIMTIESVHNKIFKYFKSLLTSKIIKKSGHGLVFGQKIMAEVMRDYPHLCRGIIIQVKRERSLEQSLERSLEQSLERSLEQPLELLPDHWLREIKKGAIGLYSFAPGLYQELDLFGTGAPILWVSLPAITDWEITAIRDGCTLMLPFQDPENIGAVIRTAVALGVRETILLKEAAHVFHPKSLRAGGSSIFRMSYRKGPSIEEIPSFIPLLQEQGIPLLTLSMEGKDLRQIHFPDRFLLLPGVEGPGLPPSLRSTSISIPMELGCESLNAATATAIALYEWKRQG